jgi:hypothetical protein
LIGVRGFIGDSKGDGRNENFSLTLLEIVREMGEMGLRVGRNLNHKLSQTPR